MPDELSPAVAVLQRKLDEQLQAVAETKKIINMLLKSMGKPAQYADVAEGSGIIRADQFYGKPLATAAQKYLELRGQACQPNEILRGMLEYDEEYLKKERRSDAVPQQRNAKKKKRGRPLKVRPVTDQVAATGPAIQPIKKKRGRPRKVDSVKGPKLLPESKSRPAVDQTAQKEVKAAM